MDFEFRSRLGWEGVSVGRRYVFDISGMGWDGMGGREPGARAALGEMLLVVYLDIAEIDEHLGQALGWWGSAAEGLEEVCET